MSLYPEHISKVSKTKKPRKTGNSAVVKKPTSTNDAATDLTGKKQLEKKNHAKQANDTQSKTQTNSVRQAGKKTRQTQMADSHIERNAVLNQKTEENDDWSFVSGSVILCVGVLAAFNFGVFQLPWAIWLALFTLIIVTQKLLLFLNYGSGNNDAPNSSTANNETNSKTNIKANSKAKNAAENTSAGWLSSKLFANEQADAVFSSSSIFPKTIPILAVKITTAVAIFCLGCFFACFKISQQPSPSAIQYNLENQIEYEKPINQINVKDANMSATVTSVVYGDTPRITVKDIIVKIPDTANVFVAGGTFYFQKTSDIYTICDGDRIDFIGNIKTKKPKNIPRNSANFTNAADSEIDKNKANNINNINNANNSDDITDNDNSDNSNNSDNCSDNNCVSLDNNNNAYNYRNYDYSEIIEIKQRSQNYKSYKNDAIDIDAAINRKNKNKSRSAYYDTNGFKSFGLNSKKEYQRQHLYQSRHQNEYGKSQNSSRYNSSKSVILSEAAISSGEMHGVSVRKKNKIRVACFVKSNIVKNIINADNSNDRGKGVVIALILGNTSFINKHDRESISKSGFAHLLAISGLHISIVAGGIFIICRIILASIPWICLRYNTKKISAIVACLSMFLYFSLTTMSISATRSVIMFGAFLAGIMLDRKTRGLRIWCIAFFCILAIEPEKIFTPSMQMSFIATFTLIASYSKITQIKKFQQGTTSKAMKFLLYPVSIVISSAIAGFASIFFEMYHFNQGALAGIISNEIAIPVTEFILLPFSVLSVALMPFNLQWLALPVSTNVGAFLCWFAQFCVSFKYSYFTTGAVSGYSLFAQSLGVVSLVRFTKKSVILGLLLICFGLAINLIINYYAH